MKKETGCCPLLKREKWDRKQFNWKKKPFYKTKYCSVFHIPINFGGVATMTMAMYNAFTGKKDLFW